MKFPGVEVHLDQNVGFLYVFFIKIQAVIGLFDIQL